MRIIQIVTPYKDLINVEISGIEKEVRELISILTKISPNDIKGLKDMYGNYYTLSFAVKNQSINSDFSKYYYLVCSNIRRINNFNDDLYDDYNEYDDFRTFMNYKKFRGFNNNDFRRKRLGQPFDYGEPYINKYNDYPNYDDYYGKNQIDNRVFKSNYRNEDIDDRFGKYSPNPIFYPYRKEKDRYDDKSDIEEEHKNIIRSLLENFYIDKEKANILFGLLNKDNMDIKRLLNNFFQGFMSLECLAENINKYLLNYNFSDTESPKEKVQNSSFTEKPSDKLLFIRKLDHKDSTKHVGLFSKSEVVTKISNLENLLQNHFDQSEISFIKHYTENNQDQVKQILDNFQLNFNTDQLINSLKLIFNNRKTQYKSDEIKNSSMTNEVLNELDLKRIVDKMHTEEKAILKVAILSEYFNDIEQISKKFKRLKSEETAMKSLKSLCQNYLEDKIFSYLTQDELNKYNELNKLRNEDLKLYFKNYIEHKNIELLRKEIHALILKKMSNKELGTIKEVFNNSSQNSQKRVSNNADSGTNSKVISNSKLPILNPFKSNNIQEEENKENKQTGQLGNQGKPFNIIPLSKDGDKLIKKQKESRKNNMAEFNIFGGGLNIKRDSHKSDIEESKGYDQDHSEENKDENENKDNEEDGEENEEEDQESEGEDEGEEDEDEDEEEDLDFDESLFPAGRTLEFLKLLKNQSWMKDKDKKLLIKLITIENDEAKKIISEYEKGTNLLTLRNKIKNAIKKWNDNGVTLESLELKTEDFPIVLDRLKNSNKINNEVFNFIVQQLKRKDNMLMLIFEKYKKNSNLKELIESIELFYKKRSKVFAGEKTPVIFNQKGKDYIDFVKTHKKIDMDEVKEKQLSLIKMLKDENIIQESAFPIIQKMIQEENQIVVSAFEIMSVTKDHWEFTETINLVIENYNSQNKDSVEKSNSQVGSNKKVEEEKAEKSKSINDYFPEINKNGFNRMEIDKLNELVSKEHKMLLGALISYQKDNDVDDLIDTLKIILKKELK